MKNLNISVLLDFYGDMLTEKQKEVIELYYNEDLSLSEIGAYEGITRQGVRDSIKRGESVLLEMEEKLGLAKRFHEMHEGIANIIRHAQEIEMFNKEYHFSKEIGDRAAEIVRVAKELEE